MARLNTNAAARMLVLGTLLLAATAAWAADLPAPLVEFTFGNGLANTGSTGGAATVSVYAKGEGPLLMPGPWGDSLDMTAASRFGGTLDDRDPAGSALFYSSAALDTLDRFTVTLWLRGATLRPVFSSRVMTKFGSWEVTYDRGVAALLLTEDFNKGKKRAYRGWRPGQDLSGQWTFSALTVDPVHKKVTIVYGDAERGLGEMHEQALAHPVVPRKSALQIGNFLDIRPFKGHMDNIRIYPVPLTPEQVRQRFEADLAARTPGARVYSLGVAAPAKRRFGFKASDIIFSCRWQRPIKDVAPLLRDYHVTHLLWVYGANPAWIRAVKDMGIFYQGTLNGMQGSQKASQDPNARKDATGRQWNLDGHKFVPPHMEAWRPKRRPWTGCHNSPAFRKIFWDAADALVKAGADAIQVDDWEMALGTSANGLGCFCPWCMKWFRAYLKRTQTPEQLRALGIDDIDTFDYGEFLKTQCGIPDAATYRKRFRFLFEEQPLTRLFVDAQRMGLRDFYQQLRKHLDEVSPGQYTPVSVNNQFFRRARDRRFRGYYSVDVVDFFIGETTQSMQTVNHFVHCVKLAEGFGVPQVMMCKPKVVAHSMAALATTYALGSWMRVPWDCYMDNDPKTRLPAPRYFGKLEDWGPFYDFIHEHPQLFNGYQSAATVGVLINGDEDTFTPFWDLAERLLEAQAPFRVIAATSQYNRLPLRRETLAAFRHVVTLSKPESFCEEDRRVIEQARASMRTRFLSPEEDVAAVLASAGQQLLKLEAPDRVYAFLRVKPGAAVVHLVNWNADASGDRSAVFKHVTLQLLHPDRWGGRVKATYYQPGQKAGVELTPEVHPGMIRITVPQLATWGVIEIMQNG